MPAARPLGFVFAVVGGLCCGLLGSFAHGYERYGVPIGLLASLGLLLAVLVSAGMLTRSRAGVLVAAASWLLVVLVLSQPRPEGDLVVPGSGLGYAWLLGGMVVSAAAAFRPYDGGREPAPPARPPQPDDPSGDAASGR
jgi:hypothetical protein